MGIVIDNHVVESLEAARGDLGDAAMCIGFAIRNAKHADRIHRMALESVAQSLTPGNQNVVDGDLLACIADLRQVNLTLKENAAEVSKMAGSLLDQVYVEIDALDPERGGQVWKFLKVLAGR